MQVIEIKKTELKVDSEDWSALERLRRNFTQICNSIACTECPLTKFCQEHQSPYGFLADLYDFLDP